METVIGNGWDEILAEEKGKKYFTDMTEFVKEEYSCRKIYPPENRIFEAFRRVSFDEIKVVIIGQDPYHGEGQANGLAFAVNDGVKAPPSLKNIFKEIENEYGKCPAGTDLTSWADSGVLLLNSVLTVREANPGSHAKCGWRIFTDRVISEISIKSSGKVFMLWGADAISKESLIDGAKHLILKSVHPSPLSAYRGFFGCGHFKKANEYLEKNGEKAVNWCV